MEKMLNETETEEYNSIIIADVNISIKENLFESENVIDNRDTEVIIDEVILWALIDGFLFLAICFGNIITIYAIVKSKTWSTTISNRFILSLAISDLTVGFMVLYHMIYYIRPGLENYFGFCIGKLVLISLACIASVFNILGITIDRYVAVVYPLRYQNIITDRSAKLISFLGWFLSFGIASTPTFWNKWNDNKDSKSKCEMGRIVHPIYVMTMYVPVYGILYTAMCAFYIKIIKETRKNAKRMNHLTNDRQSPWKSIQVLTLVLGSFTISYTPFIILVTTNSVFQRNSKITSTVYKVTYSLAVANSAVNPIIYAWKNQELKKSFWNLMHCHAVNY